MTINLGKLLKMIDTQAAEVKSKMDEMSKQGSSISVSGMLMMQLTMNKFSQMADLGSTTISLFNQSFKTMIQNVMR